MPLKNILPQLIAVGVLVLPPLIRAFMSGKSAKQGKGAPRQPTRTAIPTTKQRQAAQAWFERQQAIQRQRQAQIDARRAQVQTRMGGNSPATPVSAADLEQRRREVIAQLTQRAGVKNAPAPRPQQSRQAPSSSAPARRPSSSAGRGSQSSSPRRAQRPGQAPARPAILTDRSDEVIRLVQDQPNIASRQVSRDDRERSQRQEKALHDSVQLLKERARPPVKLAHVILNKKSLRTAFILKEVFDPPVSMRPEPVLESDVFDNAFETA